MSKKKVFITGGTGFVGYHLIKRLCQDDWHIRCLARPTSRRSALMSFDVEFIEGDIRNLNSLKQGVQDVDAVVHLAGLTRSLRRNDFMEINRDGCRNISLACLEEQKRRGTPPVLISVSSLAAAGPAPKSSPDELQRTGRKYRPKQEMDLPNPLSPYGKSKFAGEQELTKNAEQIPTSIVRPPIIFGEGDMLSLALFQMAKKTPFFLIPGYYNQYYSFIYAGDLAEILVRVLENGERLTPKSLDAIPESPSRCSGQGVYFATHPDQLLFSDFGKELGKTVHRSNVLPVYCPPLGVWGTGIFGEIRKKLTGRYAAFDWNKAIEAIHGPWICSENKVRDQLRFECSVSLPDRFQQTADWYRKEGLL